MSWREIIRTEVPAMANPLGDRWPMIAWHGPGYSTLKPEQIRTLLDRGLTQRLNLNQAHLPAARALQAAGFRVIFMHDRAGNWPYSPVADSSQWPHPFARGYTHEEAGPGPLGQW